MAAWQARRTPLGVELMPGNIDTWPASDAQALLDLWCAGHTTGFIGKRLNRPGKQVNRKIDTLGIREMHGSDCLPGTAMPPSEPPHALRIPDNTSFGSWTVLRVAERSKRSGIYYACRCKCGAEHEVAGAMLRGGRSTRCRACYADAQRLPETEPAAAPVPSPAVQRPQTAALVCEQPAGGRPAPRRYEVAPAVQWFDQSERPRCVWCGEPSLPNSARCQAHAGPRYRRTTPDAHHA
ncbi:MAG: hypothetical protein ACRYG8_09935 [Janthinobacterium lividum]